MVQCNLLISMRNEVEEQEPTFEDVILNFVIEELRAGARYTLSITRYVSKGLVSTSTKVIHAYSQVQILMQKRVIHDFN